MSMTTLSRTALGALLLLFLSACGGGEAQEGELTGSVSVDGSSTVYPITEAVAEEFMIANPRARVTVGVSGTGGGFSKFLRGETDVNDASRSIGPSEMALAAENGVEYIELPVAYDGLAVLVNPAIDFVDCLTVDELEAVWGASST
ncbi:MAG: substrate-binding domain-containing protein, partial [Rhodothermales bacterium]